jgi:hypothetical protein
VLSSPATRADVKPTKILAGLRYGGQDNMNPIAIRVVAIALTVTFGSVGGAGSPHGSEKNRTRRARSLLPDAWRTANSGQLRT